MGANNTLRIERIPVRVRGVHEAHSREKLVVLELERPFIGAQGAYFRDTPLEPGEPVVGIGYPGGTFRIVTGTFLSAIDVTFDGKHFVTEYQVDVSDGENRAVFGEGASGSPIFDCAGNVVLSVSLIKQGGISIVCTDERRGCTPGESTTLKFTLPKGEGTHIAVATSGLVRFSRTLNTN
jgi:S1-C subfamily serine protease